MGKHRHVIVHDAGEAREYKYVGVGGGASYRVPARNSRVQHSKDLIRSIEKTREELGRVHESPDHEIENVSLEVVGKIKNLQTDSLDQRRGKIGIDLRSVVEREGKRYANVFVPKSRLPSFIKQFERYATEDHRSGKPKHHDLVAGIDEIRTPILQSFWTDDPELFPKDEKEPIWWEVWVQVRKDDQDDAAFTEFVTAVAGTRLRVGSNALQFPEHLVFHVHGTRREWARVFVPLLDRLAELRKAKEIASEFLDLDAGYQRDLVDHLVARIVAPSGNKPAVCILDYGVSREHPLLRPFLREDDQHVIDPNWTAVDPRENHATEIAGLAVFGTELPTLLGGGSAPFTPHGLESVRILNDNAPNPEESWGWVTQEGVALAEQRSPKRSRVVLLATTANDRGRDRGLPTSWSAAIDQSSAGALDDARRLYVVSAGNVRSVVRDPEYSYPKSNLLHRVEDPAQSWNGLTVGACADLVQIRDPEYEGYTPLAKQGELSPMSRTSQAWDDEVWPIKPDIVLEGGNCARSPQGDVCDLDDLSLLTTSGKFRDEPLTRTLATSAAAAQAARMAAILQSDYSTLWPETIRGLLVHSASWTPSMIQQVPGDSSSDCQRRLRCFGYGKPDLDRARFTMNNRVALVHQGTLQPFHETVDDEGRKQIRTKDFRLHSLPWPIDDLRDLHDSSVRLRVTLSYFIEPSPGRRGWTRKFRYQSHGLRFKLRGPTETEDQFRRRVSAAEPWDVASAGKPRTSNPIEWALGTNLQTKGSVHSDWWDTTGAELASCGHVAVHPVTGWWRERPHLGRFANEARYSLIVTIETEATKTDLYTSIMNQIKSATEVDIRSGDESDAS